MMLDTCDGDTNSERDGARRSQMTKGGKSDA